MHKSIKTIHYLDNTHSRLQRKKEMKQKTKEKQLRIVKIVLSGVFLWSVAGRERRKLMHVLSVKYVSPAGMSMGKHASLQKTIQICLV